ncbi:MAG: ATP-binding cassette domain-containing protein [Betaproteobacteria bacterium]|nr:MAG: ATP-binding cassette domain-containing protein [Betaproteobacteria bacterium]
MTASTWTTTLGRWTRVAVRRGFLWPTIAVVAVLLLSPLLSTSTELKWTLWLAFGILALSLTLVWGISGIFSFGQNAFFGIGGYTFAVAAFNIYPATGETLSALLIAACVAALFTALLGYVTFYGRVGDVYLAIVTLAVTLILYTVMSSTAGPEYRIGKAYLGGFNGMPSVPGIAFGTGELGYGGLFAFAVCLAGALYIFARFLLTGQYGQILAGIRENEMRMELLGYNVRFHKLGIFLVGGAIAGIGGGLFTAWGTFINPSVFSLQQAALVVIWVMVGGRGSLVGAFVGVAVVQWISDQADKIVAQQTPLILGIMLLAMVLAFPGGIVPAITRWLDRTWNSSKRKLDTIDVAPTPTPRTDTKPESENEGTPLPSGHIMAHHLGKRFGGSVALDDVTLEFGQHNIHAIVGPNGAGKSTLFGLISGQHKVTKGDVELNGLDVTRMPTHQRARHGLGIKLQVPSIFLGLSVQQNIALALNAPRKYKRTRPPATTVFAMIGLLEKKHEAASNLSHGEQQWLEIGMLIAQNPSVMLFDEPAAGMTQEERKRTVELIKKLSIHHTVIVVEHDMAFVRALGAPVVMLYRGNVFRHGSFDELSNDNDVRNIYLGRKRGA